MAQLKSTNITGNLAVTGNILASKIIKLGGTANQILMADGNVIDKSSIQGTTYTGGTGISIGTGNAINHSNSVTAVTTAGLYKIKYDAQGHITGVTAVAKADITGLGIPGSDTDTGATSIEVTGTGNAITTASYNASNRKITLTKETTFLTSHQSIKNLKTDNTTAQTTSANEAIVGSGTINLHKIAKTGTYSDLIGTPDLSGFATKTDLDKYLPKTTYEWNKEYAAGGNGAVSLGRYNLYDTQLTFDITTTTTITISGKLVIAAQNGQILKVTVYGDASNTLAGYLTIYQSAITGSRSWVEVFCNFPGWSKNKVHIYAVALNSATVTRQMASVTFTNGVPSGVTSGDTKWTGTIVNDIILIKGPSSSTDNAIVRFDGTGGKTLQNSSVTIDDSGNVVPATTAASELGSSSKIWKRAYVHQLDLYREQGNNYGRISFYKPTMLTWFEYMSPNAVASPTGANTVQYGDVTSWARRSLIEPNSGYGWVWEAASNTANATVSGIMSLGSATGNLKVKGSVTANGFKHSDSTTGTNDYVLLAGGGTKAISDFAGTTYSADRGISLVSGKFGHSNTAVTAVTTAGLYKIKYDAYGHITGTESFTLPTVNNATLTMNTSGTGISGSQTFTANQSTAATFTVTLDSSAGGNRAANKVVLAAAAGQINSEKYAITSGTTVKATYQYNSTDDCVELVWA